MDTAVSNLTSRIEKLSTRLESVERKLAQGPPAAAASAAPAAATPVADGEVGPAQKEFDDLINDKLRPHLSAAKDISPILYEQEVKFISACEEESKIIGAASRSAKPTAEVLQAAAKPLFEKCGDIASYKDKYNRDKAFNNIAGIAEAAPCLDWILFEPTPAPHLGDMIPGSEFYLNRVLKDSRGKNEAEFNWCKDFIAFLKELQKYVKKVHTTGLAFNARGGSFKDALPASVPAAPSSAPPPPPPPPAGLLSETPAAAAPSKGSGAGMSSVFAQLNKGTAISSGLKHVDDKMKTKNRSAEDKAKGGLKPSQPKTAEKKTFGAAPKKVRPPVKEHNGNKWIIENWTEGNIVIDETRLNDSIYIGSCKACTVTIKGKVNSITIDGCTKAGIICDCVLAVIELVNCNSVQLQVTDKTPSINIDQCNGAQLFLTRKAMESTENPTNIYTSKTSGVNVSLPGKKPEDDMQEMAIPEQFLTLFTNGKLVTKPADAAF